MRAIVVYESMFGNTHVIADHVADGLRSGSDNADISPVEAVVVAVHDASEDLIAGADLVVVGGPTHIHGMSSQRSREGAKDIAAKEDDLDLEPNAEGPGLRDWFDELAGGRDEVPAAAFDTRVHATALVTGQASKGIAKRLRRHGFDLLVDPESFFVDKENHLEPGEAERAEAWGRTLAATLAER